MSVTCLAVTAARRDPQALPWLHDSGPAHRVEVQSAPTDTHSAPRPPGTAIPPCARLCNLYANRRAVVFSPALAAGSSGAQAPAVLGLDHSRRTCPRGASIKACIRLHAARGMLGGPRTFL